MLRKYLLIASLPILFTGCVLPGTNSAPTPFPAGYIPTVIYLTAQSINSTAAAGSIPVATPTEQPTTVSPTPAPTFTLTPAPGFSLAEIQINKPGPSSRVVSPVEVQVLAVAANSNRIDVNLFGEDGRKLGATYGYVAGNQEGDYLSLKIPFEIRAAAEVGIIQVSTRDKSGVLQSLDTVRVLLMSSGSSQVNPPGNAIYERVTFKNLPPDSHVSGGVLSLQGQFTPYNGHPVILELISKTGQGLSLRVLNFPNLDLQNFSTTLPYKVSAPTPARLFIHQEDDLLKGPVYIYSQAILLNP